MLQCPKCYRWIDDDDYWHGDKCLNCALVEEKRDVLVIKTDKPIWPGITSPNAKLHLEQLSPEVSP